MVSKITKRPDVCEWEYYSSAKLPEDGQLIKSEYGLVKTVKAPLAMLEGVTMTRGIGMLDERDSVGAHEELMSESVHGLLLLARERIRELGKYGRYAAVVHSGDKETELMVLMTMPPAWGKYDRGCERYHQLRERCVYCDWSEHGESFTDNHYVSGFLVNGTEAVIIPRSHEPSIANTSDAALNDIAHAVNACGAKYLRSWMIVCGINGHWFIETRRVTQHRAARELMLGIKSTEFPVDIETLRGEFNKRAKIKKPAKIS